MGEDQETRRIFYQNQAQNARTSQFSSRPSYSHQYATSPAMVTTASRAPPVYSTPANYTSWPGSSWPATGSNDYSRSDYGRTEYGRSEYGRSPYATVSTPFVPSSPYLAEQSYSNAPWPPLHPDDIASEHSRSTSPNPADLHNFGNPLPDGRSWRCAYPNCTSSATFTRGCDLRKHFKRHTKSIYCRYEDCQSREVGFSSKKDRDRHESRHAPRIHCTQRDCERVFSRVDNMKDHVRRIHRKNA